MSGEGEGTLRPNPNAHLGPPLPSTAADLARRAKVDGAAIEAGRRRWHETAPEGWEGLIEATEQQSKGNA